MSSTPTAPSPEIVRLIEGARPMIYNAVAASMAFVWEYCITLDVEIELVWRPKWTWITLLFLAIRYLTLTNVIITLITFTDIGQLAISKTDCSSMEQLQLISVQIVLTCVEILLITRVYALYARKKILLWVLVILFLGAAAARFSLIAVVISGLEIIPNPLLKVLPLGACLPVNLASRYSQAGIWVPEFVLQIVLFSLVISRVLWTRFHNKTTASHIMLVLVRDGIWAFVFIFGGALLSLFGLELQQKKPSSILSLMWMSSLLGFCGTRLILNLRAAALPILPTTAEAMELDVVPLRSQASYNGISIEREVVVWDGYSAVNRTDVVL